MPPPSKNVSSPNTLTRRRTMKKSLLVYLMCLVLLLTTVIAVGCQKNDPTAVTITAENGLSEIEAGKTLQLSAAVTPSNASQDVTWTSSNAAIATVDQTGKVTAVAQGNVTITATSVADGTVKGTFALVVKPASGGGTETKPTMRITVPGNANEITIGGTLQLTAQILPSTTSQEVTWASSDDAKATVDSTGKVTAVAEGLVTITATSKAVADLSKSVELTVTKPDASFEEMAFATHAEYMAAAKDTKLKVKGIVTYLSPEKDGKVNYYIQNGVDGFYIYNQDNAVYPVELGKVYAVGGLKGYSNGINEIKSVEYFKALQENIVAETTDLSSKDPSSLEEMKVFHGSKVTGTAVVTAVPNPGNKAYSVDVKINNYSTTLRIDPANMTADEYAKINTKLSSALAGTNIQFTGVMSAFGYGTPKPQIQIMLSGELIIAEATSQQKVDTVKTSLTVPAFVDTNTNSIALATSSEAFDDVVISWSSDNTAIIANDGTVTHAAQDTLVTLTATVSHKTETTATAQRAFKVNVAGTEFNGTAFVTLNFEDQEIIDAGVSQYGISNFKSGYTLKDADKNPTKEANTVTIAGKQWLLWNTLIAGDNSDHKNGTLAGRSKAGKDQENTARIELLEKGEFNYVQFKAAVYNQQQLGISIGIEYMMDGATDWTDLGIVAAVNSYELQTFRFQLPQGIKNVAIYVVANSGNTVNIDDIELGK